jgi:hypothetical protein
MITCKGFRDEYWGEWECGYFPSFDCEDCIINGGRMSPVSDKPFRGNREKYEKAIREEYFRTALAIDMFRKESRE